MGVLAASDVAVVMTLLLGHVDGEKRVAGGPGVAAFRHRQLPDRVLGAWLGDGRWSEVSDASRRFFRAKVQCSGTNGGGACGCRYPHGGVVVGTFAVLGLRVKTLDFGLDNGGATRRYLPGGIVVELRCLSVSCSRHWWQVGFLCFFLFILDLLCKRVASSRCIGLAVGLYL